MRSLKIGALMVAVTLSATLASAQVAAAPVTRVVHKGAQSMIHGVAVDVDSHPLPNVNVRLRNLKANKVEQKTTANLAGEFNFVAQPEIPYVVELADQTGRIVAVGDVIVVHAGEVAAAMVAIPTRLPTLAGVFGETAGSVISAAAGTGLTALQSTVAAPPPPASPEQ
jgi:hypothetical protein